MRLTIGGQRYSTIHKRSVFLAAAQHGHKWVTPAFVLQYLPFSDTAAAHPSFQFGFTATRKLGGAVQRGRAKRRMRALVHTTFAPCLDGFSAPAAFVLIARQPILEKDMTALEKDLRWALRKLQSRLQEAA